VRFSARGLQQNGAAGFSRCGEISDSIFRDFGMLRLHLTQTEMLKFNAVRE